MYASFYNHFNNLAHYFVAIIIIFIIVPRFLFKNKNESLLEFIFSNFIRIVALYIVIGYALVLLKIFEVIGILIVLAAIWFYVKFIRPSNNDLAKIMHSVNIWLYDYVDGIINRRKILSRFIKRKIRKNWNAFKGLFKSGFNIVNFVLLISVLGYSAYLRIYDALMNAAPAMSDAYVTLAWMKYINKRVLFHDGIYPQGFHIILATIQKFAFIDPLYVLKYTGPFNGVMIAFGIYFVTSRISKKMAPGIIAALIYGVLGGTFFGDWTRQAASNSQEFGFVFVLPTLYFFYKYMESREKQYLMTAFCGAAVCGLVHAISLVFVVFGVVILIFASLLLNFKTSVKLVLKTILAGIIIAVISIVPAGIGLVMGANFHGSSAEFISSSDNTLPLTALNGLDYLALGCLGLIFIYIFISKGKFRTKLLNVFTFLFGSASFLIYYAGGYYTKSLIVSERFTDLWHITAPIVVGFGFFILLRIFYKLKIYDIILSILCVAIMVSSVYYYKPKVISPYKMEYDSNIEQYFRITSECHPTEWMMVSQDEGYAVVLGTGYHMLVQNFLNAYDPSSKYLIDKENNEVLKTKDIFIYYEKNIFTTSFDTMQKIYERRRIDQPILADWIKTYGETHSNMTKFYEDSNIAIYRIHQEPTKQEKFDRIWGEKTG